MQRFTIEVGTDGNNDIVNLQPELETRPAAAGRRVDPPVRRRQHRRADDDRVRAGPREARPARRPATAAPDDARYEHEATWNDDNGHSHVRASLLGQGLAIPFANGRLLTGQYQQVVLVDLDTRPRAGGRSSRPW